ncbi:MAG TPA: hypothetical protein ENL42_05530 [Thermoplasmatales archaeon]|nr:hypothetical protein [Thermoplasmatales archaeon]
MKKIFAVIIAILLLNIFAGCVFRQKGDRDGDGLPDEREEEGWEVNVIYPDSKNITTYTVTSDPTKKDTDGDGLSDLEEFLYPGGATDPTKKDTDGDGLSDLEEKELGSDPRDWRGDIDVDGFLDYYEILYYEKHNISHEKIIQYLQTKDVDKDGVPDGYDIDPLRDLKIKIWIKNIIITSDMGDSDGNIELRINISTGNEWAVFPEGIPFLVTPVNKNESINFSYVFDLSDYGVPGNASHPLMIVVEDIDEGLEINLKDGIAGYDLVKVFSSNVSPPSPVYAKNINIFKDCGKYHEKGVDGEIWFEIIDASVGES